jgi:hypothetical protein
MKKYFLLPAAAFLITACNPKESSPAKETKKDSPAITEPQIPEKAPEKIDTVPRLNEISSEAGTHYFKAPDGQFYKVTLMDANEAETHIGLTAESLDCQTDIFHGNDRKAAKLSLVTAGLESFTSLTAFLNTLRPDDEMINNGSISMSATNKRVAAEKRNIKLTNVFLFAIKRESDNDYHLIIGDQNNNYFNIECSGLPGSSASAFATIKKVRKQVEDFFGELCKTQYAVFENGLKLVEVKGSLFYDIDHKPGVVGPEGRRPKTAWEIHPISNIKFPANN